MEIHATSPSANALTKSLMDQPSQKTVDHVKHASQSSNEESNVDFRNMSRDDLKEWLNEEIKAGNMTGQPHECSLINHATEARC